MAPNLPRSVGFLPVFFPPERGLGHGPVHGQPPPIEPLQLVVLQQALLPELGEDASLHPLLEAAVGGALGADAGRRQRAPLAAGAQREEDGIHGLAISDAWVVAAEGVGLAGRQQRLDAPPQGVGDAPAVIDHGRRGVRLPSLSFGHGRGPYNGNYTAAVVGTPPLLG